MTANQIFLTCFAALFLLFLVYVGKQAKGQIKTHTDFHLAGRQMSWFVIAAGLIGTNFSGAAITSGVSLNYQFGFGGMWFQFSMLLGFLICAVIYAKRVRQTGAFTISELFEIRYSFSTRLIAGVFIMCSGIAAAAAQFKAIGLIMSTVYGIPEIYGILACWVIILLYMTMAGFWATNLTNIPQLVFCIIGIPGVLIWCIWNYGSPAEVLPLLEIPERVADSYFTMWGVPLVLVMTWFLQWTWTNVWNSQWYFQRASAARNIRHARIGFLVTGFTMIFATLIPAWGIGNYARFVDPNLANPEAALSMMISLSPLILCGLASIGIFAAVMSTVDACAMGAITVLARDFYHRTLKPHATPQEMTMISRIITVVVLVVILLFATSLKSALQGLNWIFVFNTGILGAIIGALFWKKACKEAAILSIVIAGVMATVWTLWGEPGRFQGAWWSLLFSIVIMVVVSLIVAKTGPWWGKDKKEVADEAIINDIVAFMANRNATLADIIDRTGAHAHDLRIVLSKMIASGRIREIDYMTFSLAENSKPEDSFVADHSNKRDLIMVSAAILVVICFAIIWVKSM